MNDIGIKELETERLILRKFNENDYKGMFDNWASDLETNKYVSFKPHQNYDETKQIINEWISKYEDGGLNWVVELKDSHEIIGNIEVISKSKKNNNCEVGYTFGSRFWGKGYDETWKRNIEERNKRIEDGNGGSDFYLDEGLLKKLESKWEEPSEEEIDILYNVKR